MRVVVDANVAIAAVAARGLCEAVFELCLERHEMEGTEDAEEKEVSRKARRAREGMRGKRGSPDKSMQEVFNRVLSPSFF